MESLAPDSGGVNKWKSRLGVLDCMEMLGYPPYFEFHGAVKADLCQGGVPFSPVGEWPEDTGDELLELVEMPLGLRAAALRFFSLVACWT
jgi:hypothetical protein